MSATVIIKKRESKTFLVIDIELTTWEKKGLQMTEELPQQ
jgi:hypothetical protein